MQLRTVMLLECFESDSSAAKVYQCEKHKMNIFLEILHLVRLGMHKITLCKMSYLC